VIILCPGVWPGQDVKNRKNMKNVEYVKYVRYMHVSDQSSVK
jgi:hypothetical protein